MASKQIDIKYVCCSIIFDFINKRGGPVFGAKSLKFDGKKIPSCFLSVSIRYCFDCDFIAALLSPGKWKRKTHIHGSFQSSLYNAECRFIIIVLSLYSTLQRYRTKKRERKRKSKDLVSTHAKIVLISGRTAVRINSRTKFTWNSRGFFVFFTATSFRLKIGFHESISNTVDTVVYSHILRSQ